MGLTQDLKNAQMWPIRAKGKVTRLSPLGDPKVEKFFHKSLEPGRHLEVSLGDANNWLAERKREVLARIQIMLDINTVSLSSQFAKGPRRVALKLNIISFLKEVSAFQSEITGLISAVTQNIGMLQSMEQNMLRMVQANLNAIANILNDICNWGLPDLPAIPNLFSDNIWQWNGFNFFPLASFQPHIGFDKNFAFGMCNIHIPNLDIFRNYPSTVQTYSGLQYGTSAFVPPLDGAIFGPNFNPNSSMFGSVPDPSTIINDFQMPAQTYQDNIVSIVPATRDAVTDTSTSLRATLAHFVTLAQVVDSNFDPNTTAEWLFYLNSARTGRGGLWIQNFQTVYAELIAPSVSYLQQTAVPWNNFTGTVVDSPPAIPLIATLTSGAGAQLNLLWKLSYVEAAILGYTRNARWDAGADPSYLGNFTGSDVDYRSTPVASASASVILGAGTAQFPVVCTFPSAIAASLATIIARATENIANTPTYQSAHPQFRFTFDSFAVAVQVDRFTQFWREFNANLQVLLVQDPYLVGFTVTYPDALDSAIDPLEDPTDYAAIKSDVAARNRSWIPGTPLLNLPLVPDVKFSSNTLPTDATNGWSGLDLDPVAFLARPDIQGQPIPVQTAMLRTNLSFAAISKFRDAAIAEIESQITSAAAAIASGLLGFQVEIALVTPQVVLPSTLLQLAFDKTDFDITGYVTNPTTFTVQTSGIFVVSGEIDWSPGEIGTTYTVVVKKNGTPIVFDSPGSDSFTSVSTDPVLFSFSTTGEFTAGDVITVFVSHNSGTSQNVVAGSRFGMLLESTSAPGPDTGTNSTKVFTAGATTTQNYNTVPAAFPLPIIIHIDGTGSAVPLDPTTIIFDTSFILSSIMGNGTIWTGTTSTPHGFSPGDTVSILDTAHFNGTYILVAPTSGITFTISSTLNNGTTDSTVSPPQSVQGGSVIFPFADGMMLDNAVDGTTTVVPGNTADAATYYGGEFQLHAGSPPLTPGGLIYVGPSGTITQDYETLITGVQWIVCIGRALTSDVFIWEPHIPSRVNMVF